MRDLANWQECAVPHGFSAEGRTVAIVPFEPQTHVGPLWEAFGGEAGINALLHYFPDPPFGAVSEFGRWLEAAQGRLATSVFLDATTRAVVGMASYMRVDAANGCAEVGAVAHGPAMARSAAATEAHWLMARHVFDDLGYRRYEWKCHNENEGSKRAAERLGFTFEGVFRQHMISKGANRDTAWYAIIDADWPLVGAAMEEWLSPGNFDPSGAQRERLEDIRARLGGTVAQSTRKAHAKC